MKKNILKVVVALTVLITLTSCSQSGNDNANTNGVPGQKTYDASELKINYPDDWDVLGNKDMDSNLTKDTIVLFRNNIKSPVFTANLNIMKLKLEKPISSNNLAINSKQAIKDTLLSFEEISTTKETMGTLLIFQGKQKATQPVIQFQRLYVAQNNTAFVITAAYLPEEDESILKMLEEMLNSFTLK